MLALVNSCWTWFVSWNRWDSKSAGRHCRFAFWHFPDWLGRWKRACDRLVVSNHVASWWSGDSSPRAKARVHALFLTQPTWRGKVEYERWKTTFEFTLCFCNFVYHSSTWSKYHTFRRLKRFLFVLQAVYHGRPHRLEYREFATGAGKGSSWCRVIIIIAVANAGNKRHSNVRTVTTAQSEETISRGISGFCIRNTMIHNPQSSLPFCGSLFLYWMMLFHGYGLALLKLGCRGCDGSNCVL